MNISVFVTIWIAGMSSMNLNNYFLDAPLAFLKSNPDILAVEFYIPEHSDKRVHEMDDVPAPTLIVQINFDSAEKSMHLTESEKFKKLFTDKQGFAKPAEKINLEILEAIHFNLPGHKAPAPRTAPMSFVVRYYGPVSDGSEFAGHYIDSHPPIMSKFPGIRNVLCYLPLDWRTMDEVKDERMIIGNEVVFDDLESFKKALASDVFIELEADAEKFEPWGYSTHHAMHREMVYSRQ